MLSLSYIKLGVLTWYEYNVGMMGDADEQPWYLLYFLQKFDCLFPSVIKVNYDALVSYSACLSSKGAISTN